MPEPKSKNDVAWEALFTEYDILNHIKRDGIYRISAAAINKKREARLMTKFDHAINLPQVFAENRLAILPASRSSYIIGNFECYTQLQESKDTIIEKPFPEGIASLSPNNLYSESSALLCAYHAGLISDVLEDRSKFTVFGRMSTGKFDFSIKALDSNGAIRKTLTVDKAQCEIDGGFEGTEAFAVLEVKNEEVEDFHIRQLYFPYRLWRNNLQKRVRPIFMTYSNEVFTFSVYDFEQLEDYNSLKLIKKKRYQIVPTEIGLSDILRIVAQTQVKPEPPAPISFPQADRIERIIDLLAKLYVAEGTVSQEDITTGYAFDRRQTQYYTNAGQYLGVIERTVEPERGVCYGLTEVGALLMNRAPQVRNLTLIELILQHGVFHNAVKYYLDNSRPPSKADILNMMHKAALPLNDTTKERRTQSVLGWIRWIMQLTAEA